jgi:hypothetical protein
VALLPALCPAGQFSLAGAANCSACTVNAFYCPAGSSSPNAAACPAGFYCARGAITACPAGTFNPLPLQSSASACQPCDGSTQPAMTTCLVLTGVQLQPRNSANLAFAGAWNHAALSVSVIGNVSIPACPFTDSNASQPSVAVQLACSVVQFTNSTLICSLEAPAGQVPSRHRMLVCDCGAVRGELQRHGLIGAELGRLQGLLLQRQKRPRLRVQRHASEARAIADNGASSEPAIDDLRVVQVQCTLPSTVPSPLVEQQLHFKVQASIPNSNRRQRG